MRTKIALAGAGVLALGAAANADFVDVSVVNAGDLGAGANSYQIFVNFDAVDDTLLAVGGLVGNAALEFTSDVPLIQNAGVFDGLIQGDTRSLLDAGGDSWVNIGLASDTAFSPGFGGGDGALSVINGTSFSEADGGYFDQNPGTPEGGIGSTIIAQFTLDLAPGQTATYSGLINWRDDSLPSGQFISSFFSVTIPGPGALAVLGLAGLAGSRRRRG